ncbi:iron-sulfur cluster repair protein YtfE (RIC family) [Amorphus suaedae]
MEMDDLEARSGLPDALRVLLEKYPRDGWANGTPMGGLTQFWLERHLMFRQLLTQLVEDGQALVDADMAAEDYGKRLSRFGGFLVNQLHEHHHVEDAHYFPLLAAKEPRLAPGFELLDRDHVALDGHLTTFTQEANALLQALQAGAATGGEDGRLLATLGRLNGFLDRHLTDEEEIVIPVLLEYGEGSLG